MDDLISRQDAITVCNSAIDLWEGQLGVGALVAVRDKTAELPSAEPEITRCKNCKYRNTEECPMHYEEWVSFEEDGYIDSDYVAHDQTRDDGFCDRGEEEDE